MSMVLSGKVDASVLATFTIICTNVLASGPWGAASAIKVQILPVLDGDVATQYEYGLATGGARCNAHLRS